VLVNSIYRFTLTSQLPRCLIGFRRRLYSQSSLKQRRTVDATTMATCRSGRCFVVAYHRTCSPGGGVSVWWTVIHAAVKLVTGRWGCLEMTYRWRTATAAGIIFILHFALRWTVVQVKPDCLGQEIKNYCLKEWNKNNSQQKNKNNNFSWAW